MPEVMLGWGAWPSTELAGDGGALDSEGVGGADGLPLKDLLGDKHTCIWVFFGVQLADLCSQETVSHGSNPPPWKALVG